jgi:ribonuclease HI
VIEIYTDGASRGNPGAGAYAVFMKHKLGHKTISKAFRRTTNNRMELMAVIAGLEAIKLRGQRVEVYSDSKYVVDAINKGWLKGWLNKDFKKVKNVDLWKSFVSQYQNHDVTMFWIRGHSGHPENEMCDSLAQEAIDSGQYDVDYGYEVVG